MTLKEFYSDFEFEDLYSFLDSENTSEWEELRQLGIDKVYFSGHHPAILFKEVSNFNDEALKEIARAQHLCWNYRKVVFLFALSKTEIRIYNCSKKPFNYENSTLNLSNELGRLEVIRSEFSDLKTVQTIKNIFSRVAVDCGLLWSTDNKLKDKVSLQERIDKYLVKSLLSAAKLLKKEGLTEDVIHSLLMRSIFLMYLEDKGAAKETNLYKNILPDANSYLDILSNKSSTYSLFEKVEEHFNGNVFPVITGEIRSVNIIHLNIVKKCLYDGNLSGNPTLFPGWRMFRFDIIQIELLSEIYEHFLEEFKESQKEKAGQYYTPPSLVELILNEKLKTKGEINWNVRILDPACGSGIFLVESFKRLVKRWKNANPTKQIKFSELRQILKDHIFGIEYDKFAIKVTAFSLYLAMLEHVNPRTLWIDKRYKFPNLIFDPKDKSIKEQGNNLLRQDTIGDVAENQFGQIDLVVGNPPFGSKINLKSVKDYCVERGFGQDMVVPFLHKATRFSEEGSIALIFNTKILTNIESPFQNFREWFFNSNYVEKIYNFSIFRRAPKTFGGQLFSSAVGPVSIAFYQKKAPSVTSSKIEYWAPKSYVKNNLIEGIMIDATDIKFLPREECQKPDTKIWKIAMWGTLEDYNLIKKLEDLPRLSEMLTEMGVKRSVGLQFLYKSSKEPIIDNELARLNYIRPEAIQRFYSPKEKFIKLQDGLSNDLKKIYRKYYKLTESDSIKSINAFRRVGKHSEVYKAPHLLIKSGLSNKKLCASYVSQDCTFNDKVLGISSNSEVFLKALSAILNSSIATYYLFLISSSIGIEREEIKPNEVYHLPIKQDEAIFEALAKLINHLIKKVTQNHPMNVDLSDIEKTINDSVFELYSLTQNEKILVDDFVNINLDLLFHGHKSVSLKSINNNENKAYASLIAKEMNSFLLEEKLIVNAAYFDIRRINPLNIVKISFEEKKKETMSFGNDLYDTYLTAINTYTTESLAQSIYLQKQIKYHDDNSIFIVKPNQKRFWSKSAAINDAKELINEILKMS